jgi:hypothetical protein
MKKKTKSPILEVCYNVLVCTKLELRSLNIIFKSQESQEWKSQCYQNDLKNVI